MFSPVPLPKCESTVDWILNRGLHGNSPLALRPFICLLHQPWLCECFEIYGFIMMLVRFFISFFEIFECHTSLQMLVACILPIFDLESRIARLGIDHSRCIILLSYPMLRISEREYTAYHIHMKNLQLLVKLFFPKK